MQIKKRGLVRSLVILLVLLFGSTSLTAQTGKRVKVLGVSVAGNKLFDESLIKLTSGLTVGSEITGDDIQTAIKNLWELKLFSDIQVVLEREIANSVFLQIKVEELPALEKVQLVGNDKIKKKDLEKEMPFFTGQTVGWGRVNQVKRKMINLYQEKGYLLAEIKPEVLPSTTDSNRVIVRYNINEGNKVQVKKINFHGNVTFSDKKLRKQFKEIKEDKWWRGADFDAEKFAEDKAKLLEFYSSEGFREAEVVRDSIYYDATKKDMYIDIWVAENTRFYYGDVTFEGNKLYTDEQLYAVAGIREGEIYSSKDLQDALVEKLGTLYYDAGYIYANIQPRETPVEKDTVNIAFLIDEAKAVKIRKIRIKGNSTTKDKVIRRELFMRPGQTFSKAALMRSQREVWVLNYFGNVIPNIEPVDDENIDVVFEVEERGTSTANMSAGWSERDRIIGSIGVNMNNLFGGGQRFGIDWNFGRYYRSFQINFTEPWLLDTPTLAGFSVYDIKRDADFTGYRQRSQGGSMRVGRRFRWPDNYFRGDWIYRLDRTDLQFATENIARFFNPEDYPLTSSSVTQQITRNSLNRVEFPTEGSSFMLSTEIAGGALGGTVSYHKHQFQSEWFSPLLGPLVVRSQFIAGAIAEFGSNGRVPYLERYFLGGEGLTRSTPLRGYDDPLSNNSRGDRTGGIAMMKASMEIRLPISPNPTIYALTFAEAGETWNTFRDVNPYALRRSVGVGARVFMPMIGMLGFDYAYGFDAFDPKQVEPAVRGNRILSLDSRSKQDAGHNLGGRPGTFPARGALNLRPMTAT